MQKAGADFSNNFISEAEKNVILFRLFGYRSCISVKLGKGEKDYFGRYQDKLNNLGCLIYMFIEHFS